MKTFSMIKPDAIKKGCHFDILEILTNDGFKVLKIKKTKLSNEQINEFYSEHCEKPWFGEVRDFIGSSEVILMMLERDDAVPRLREIMGATNSADAAPGTIRDKYGDKTNIMMNCIHGSDSAESAQRELGIFFS